MIEEIQEFAEGSDTLYLIIYPFSHTILLKHFLKFYHNHVSAILVELNLSIEEMILLRLVAIFLPC